MIAIDSGQIAAMTAQLRAAVARVQTAAAGAAPAAAAPAASKPDFAQALREQLDQVNELQQKSQQLGERFSLGDDSVHLSDVMIAGQKSSIALQATIQVRNKLVAAYQDIMNMQV
jgi:flagellar hook-basal body complex protein FliE